MVDENTVVMGIGNNRSFRNLERNPKAAFIVVEPGKTPSDWRGARIYLEAVDMETGGPFYEDIKQTISKQWGQETADQVHAAIRFKITEVRPIID
ncbi:MAG: pyridoxamine 5'-phosphate oxidase family protein [Deltaproteobacteria bacterium]